MPDNVAGLSAALVGRYRIDRELGVGGMATVYLAQDLRHDRKVALKVLRPELAALIGPQRFLAEIKTTANLQHPHILPLFDSGTADGVVFYVMPFVDGESLRERLRRERQLPIDAAVRIAREVADALGYAHDHGIIHRDIKPENILLQGGHALVADFGIALAASRSDGGARLTEAGLSLGTPYYMAPEQATGDPEITGRADIYALGCVLHEMLTGEPPFVGATAQAVLSRMMTEEPRPLALQRKTIPPHVDEAVQIALAKLPADRFGSAAEFAAALSGQATAGVIARARSTSATTQARSRLTVSAAVPWLVAALGLGVAGWATLRPKQPAPVERFGIAIPDSMAIQTDHLNHSLALSPDGRRLVYTGTAPNGARVLYLRETGRLAPRLLPATEGAEDPFFSPDGEWVAYFTLNRLMRVGLDGAPPLTVATVASSRGGTWATDNRIVYAGTNSGLVSVPASGGPADTLLSLSADSSISSFRRPFMLPGGKAILFTAMSSGGTRVGAFDLASGQIHWLADDAFDARFVSSGHLVYGTSGGVLVASPFDAGTLRVTGSPVSLLEGIVIKMPSALAEFAVADAGRLAYLGGGFARRALVTVDRGGTEQVVSQMTNLAGPRFSPDGKRVAISGTEGGSTDLHVIDLVAGTTSRLTFGGVNQYPEWTPDGGRIAFSTSRPGSDGPDLYWTAADGSGEATPLVRAPGSQFEVQFSPDGRTMVYRTATPTSIRDLHWSPIDNPSASQPWIMSPFSERSPAMSPDGHWLAYTSDESGREEVYVGTFPARAGRLQISTAGGTAPRWGTNGSEILYRVGDTLFSVAVRTRPAFEILRRSVVFVRSYPQLDVNHTHWDVSPDGRRFLFIKAESAAPDIVMVLNWDEELRRRAPR